MNAHRLNAEKLLNVELPAGYADFVAGRAGGPRDDGLLLYGLEDLAERNATFDVQACLPGFVLIGDDSGGQCFLLKGAASLDGRVFCSGLGSLCEEDLAVVAESFSVWSQGGFPLPR